MSPILGSRTMSPRGYGFAGAGVPQAPTIGTVTGTNSTTLSVPFTAASDGGLAITSYVATSTPSIALTVTGTSTP